MSSPLATLTARYHGLSDGRRGFVRGATGMGLLAALPVIISISVLGVSIDQWISMRMLVLTVIFAFAAQAWNVMSGYTGLFSFGHAVFFGTGAYATQLLLNDFGINPWIGMIVGAIIAMGIGLLIGWLTFRFEVEGHYFALTTFAFAELARHTVNNSPELNGPNGYFLPLPNEYASDYGLLAFQFRSDTEYYYVALAFLALMTLLAWQIKRSWIGLYMFAIREDEQAARSIGVPTYRYKMLGIAISGFFTAWAGAFWSMYFSSIRPGTVFDLFINVEVLLPAVIGGLGTVAGPIVGSFLITPLSEVLRQTIGVPGVDLIIYGILLVLIPIYTPRGIIFWPEKIRGVIRRRRTRGGDTDE
ncbi:branched-chain amino acid ABC transporter permease [Halovivax gelatinilyticus]|uniref:branched-chain amino acid ABC transporter permease n=1 Tax=Halovivax gelatinilyticus TaxID=2961597 RepID=UPI0020CA583D|nr:branched-chain amino acid ABC transporter permease [Halovivax gelatinilyticus]